MSLILSGSDGLSDVDGTAATPALRGTDANTGIFFPAADTIAFSEGGVEIARFDSSGNLGIGTNSLAGYRVSVKQSGNTSLASIGIASINSANDTYIGMGYNATTDTCRILASYDSNGAFKPITFLTSDVERMRIDTSGNVGIGTSSPSAGLHVNKVGGSGTILAQHPGNTAFGVVILAETTAGTDDPAIAFKNYNGGSPVYYGISCTDDGSLAFKSGTNPLASFGTERARIDSSGNLLVNTTANQNGVVASIGRTGSIAAASFGVFANADAAVVLRNAAGSLVGSIVVNASATVYNTTSDYRLKTVIGPVADAGQRIDALQPVEYTWNSDGSRTRGFLAHKFQEVYAGSVTGSKDAVDAEGKPVYQQMQASTSEVIADLVAEIQSLRQRLAALESN